MAALDLYHIDWTTLSPSLNLVAVLELPIVHSIQRPPPAYSLGIGLQMSSTPDFTIPEAAVVCRCDFISVSQSGLPAAYADGPPSIFAPAQSSQLLRVRLNFPYTESIHEPPTRDTSLYVPFQVIFDHVRSSHNTSSVQRIQWDLWGPRTRWIHLPPSFWEAEHRAPSGTRCLLTRHSASHQATARFNSDAKHEVDFLFLDFNTNSAIGAVRNTGQSNSEGEDDCSQLWAYQSSTNNHMSPVTPYVDQKHSWLMDCGADIAVTPYVWSNLKHEYFDDLAQKINWHVVMDNEHG